MLFRRLFTNLARHSNHSYDLVTLNHQTVNHSTFNHRHLITWTVNHRTFNLSGDYLSVHRSYTVQLLTSHCLDCMILRPTPLKSK